MPVSNPQEAQAAAIKKSVGEFTQFMGNCLNSVLERVELPTQNFDTSHSTVNNSG